MKAQETPTPPVGLTVRCRTGETQPVEVRYGGLKGGRHQWYSTEQFFPSQVWRVGWRWISPDADVEILLREPR